MKRETPTSPTHFRPLMPRWTLGVATLLFGMLFGLGAYTFNYAEGTRVTIIQDKTAELLRRSEEALLAAVDAIVAAREAGATDEDLTEALQLHRSAQLRWDFISSENSTGFHSPQESARVLAEATDLARQAELEAWQVAAKRQP